MAGKVRVFELAKKLGMASKDLMGLLQDLDITVTSPMAELEPGVDKMIQKKLGGQRATSRRLAASTKAAAEEAGGQGAAPVKRGKITRKARKVDTSSGTQPVPIAAGSSGISTVVPRRATVRTGVGPQLAAASMAGATEAESPPAPQPVMGPMTAEQVAAAAVAPAPTIATAPVIATAGPAPAAPAAPPPTVEPSEAPAPPALLEEAPREDEFQPAVSYPETAEAALAAPPSVDTATPTRPSALPDPAILARVHSTERKKKKKTNLREKVKEKLKESKERPSAEPILPRVNQDVSERQQRRKDRPKERVVSVPEVVTLDELARLMTVKANELILALMKDGVMATKNQQLDLDIVELLADKYDYEVRVSTQDTDIEAGLEEDKPEDLEPRAPIVTVMGHVDHGKTSLLDHIRNSQVASGEAGGITQHIGAYNVQTDHGRVVFLDTPGHEAFTAMRAHGANVTDVVVLVVAGDDGVKPQTVEAINHAHAASVPILVAINKMDKAEAEPDRVRRELSEHNVFVEGWGGEVQTVEVSALTGTGVSDLLERLALESEILELKANPKREARGVVIEARLDRGRGAVATILVQHGTLRVGDVFVTGMQYGRVRGMFDEHGEALTEAGPATPVEILGLSGVPQASDSFIVLEDERKARQISEERLRRNRMKEVTTPQLRVTLDDLHKFIAEGEIEHLHVIIKADVQGSAVAIQDSLEKLSTDEVQLTAIHIGVGGITESDVNLASASNALIIGFNVRPEPKAKRLSDSERVDIRLYRVIYDVIDDVKAAMAGLLKPESREVVTGRAEVRDSFRISGTGTIAGCMVLSGELSRSDRVRVIRDSVVVYEGAVGSLRRFKEDTKSVQAGLECGLGIEHFNDVKVGDVLETYLIESVERTL